VGFCIVPINMKSANTTYISSVMTGFQSRILEHNGMELIACIFVLHKYLFHALFVPLVNQKEHFEHFSTVNFILGFILRPTVINKLFPLPYIFCHILSHKYSIWRTGHSSKLHFVIFIFAAFHTNYLAYSQIFGQT
jgi:hypothetical protein